MGKTTKRIEVFRPGTFTPMAGPSLTFSADDLRAMAGAYDAAAAPAPVVVGHPTTDAPAYAWATAFAFDEQSQRLVADLGDIEPQFADQVAQGRFKKISLSLFGPDAPNNPKPGQFYPKHIGFLGAAAPAVSGLRPVSFASDAGALTFEYGDASALRDVASLFRSLREFMISKFGMESADQALPNWTIGWVDDAADRDPPKAPSAPLPAFSAPLPAPKEPNMADPVIPSEAELTARLADIERREREHHTRDNLAFAEALVAAGKLLPVLKDKVVGLLNGLVVPGSGKMVVSFSEAGADKTAGAAELLREILNAQPKVVSFGEASLGDPPGELDFASVEGVAMKAVAFQSEQAAKGIKVSTAEAVDHVSKGGRA